MVMLWVLLTLAPVARGDERFNLQDNPMKSARRQYFNDTYRDWVEANVLPLPYTYETPLTYRWDELQNGSMDGPITPLDVVMMTQASPERLPFIRRAMTLFLGPVAITVYIPRPKEHPEAMQCRQRVLSYMTNTLVQLAATTGTKAPPLALRLLYANSESPIIHCNLTEMSDGLNQAWINEAVWHRDIRGSSYLEIYNTEYPVGALRQLSLELVPDDKFVFLMDGDFVFPPRFAEKLTRSSSTGDILSTMRKEWEDNMSRRAIIIPAFERGIEPVSPTARTECASDLTATITRDYPCWIYSGKLDVPTNKKYLAKMVQKRAAIPFYESRWRLGHGCYRPRRTLMTSNPYDFQYTHPCEPYMVGLKAAMPAFDERWRGRDLNKINYLSHVWAWGTRFTVEPNLFMIHLPHTKATSLIFGMNRLPADMEVYKHEARCLPFMLTRIFMADISFQEETRRNVMPWVPNRDPSEMDALLARDRRWLTTQAFQSRRVEPWRSGLLQQSQLGANVTLPEIERGIQTESTQPQNTVVTECVGGSCADYVRN